MKAEQAAEYRFNSYMVRLKEIFFRDPLTEK